MLYRYWRLALFSLGFAALFIQQSLSDVSSAQSQNSQSSKSALPLKWSGKDWKLYPSVRSACNSFVSKGYALDKIVKHRIPPNFICYLKDTRLSDEDPRRFPISTTAKCPEHYQYYGDYDKGFCVLNKLANQPGFDPTKIKLGKKEASGKPEYTDKPLTKNLRGPYSCDNPLLEGGCGGGGRLSEGSGRNSNLRNSLVESAKSRNSVEPPANRAYKQTKSGLSGKEAASDKPSWASGERPYVGESGKDFATRLLDKRYGKGNYDKGSNSEYSKIKKWGERAFQDP